MRRSFPLAMVGAALLAGCGTVDDPQTAPITTVATIPPGVRVANDLDRAHGVIQAQRSVYRVLSADGRSLGTAWTFGPHRLVTAAHVLKGGAVTLRNIQTGRRTAATTLASSAEDDLATLSASVPPPYLEFLDLKNGRPTDRPTDHPVDAIVLGASSSPAFPRVHVGPTTPVNVAGKTRRLLSLNGKTAPGDSGAPVVTRDGNVHGVLVAGQGTRSYAEGRPGIEAAVARAQAKLFPRYVETK